MASQDLTHEAREGFAAQLDGKPAHLACPHYTSSPAGMAWLVGSWLQKTGRPAPHDVRMPRGYAVRVGDMRVSVANAAALVSAASDNFIRKGFPSGSRQRGEIAGGN